MTFAASLSSSLGGHSPSAQWTHGNTLEKSRNISSLIIYTHSITRCDVGCGVIMIVWVVRKQCFSGEFHANMNSLKVHLFGQWRKTRSIKYDAAHWTHRLYSWMNVIILIRSQTSFLLIGSVEDGAALLQNMGKRCVCFTSSCHGKTSICQNGSSSRNYKHIIK